MSGADFTGGSADIYKCFDQILRPLVNMVLVAAGMPEKVVETYIKLIGNLKVTTLYPEGRGKHTADPRAFRRATPCQ